tara:strand:+ start:132401 stop:133510 length:1110 start_codon:yes stop_codon:yes gene_type:complete
MLAVLSDGAAQAESLPDVAVAGQGAVVLSEHIFDIENKPTKECHATTIVETPEGMVAAWFAGTKEKDPDVGIRVSRRISGEWTKPVEVINGVQSDELRYPTWNPVLFQPDKGPLILFYKVGPDPRQWWGMKMTSTDHGKTWSKPEKLGESSSIGHLLGPVKNKPIQLSDGSILCPSSTEVDQADGPAVWRVHFERTSDLGKTWKVIGPIHTGKDFHAIQPSILTHPDGRLQILCRSREKTVVQSWSSDGGNTWSKLAATSLPNPNSGTDALTLADGRHLIVYNHTDGKRDANKPRYMLNVAVSEDGRHWHPALTLERESTPMPTVPEDRRHWGEYSYPAVIQSADGMVHVTYTYNREGVKHVVIDPSKL